MIKIFACSPEFHITHRDQPPYKNHFSQNCTNLDRPVGIIRKSIDTAQESAAVNTRKPPSFQGQPSSRQ